MSDATAIAIGKQLNADRVIVGSVVKFGKTLTVNARAIDVNTYQVRAAQSLRANSDEELSLVSAVLVARNLLQTLPLKLPPSKLRGSRLMQHLALILVD